jgi:hypothetical protein
MEILGARPVWSMSDSEKLSALDAVVAEQSRLETVRLQLVASLDQSGYAKEIGSGDTARLLSARYRQDLSQTRRDVRTANRLTAYAATSEALPDPAAPFEAPSYAEGATDESGTTSGWKVSPAQAAAIIAVLDSMPPTVPPGSLAVAEQELIGLAATHTPSELRKAGRLIRDLLDTDGPEPDEKAAYARESLTMKSEERGVTFRGYLANENAELFRTLIHAYARPHKTVDGELDPRPHSKRQADALTTILNAATTASAQPSTSRSTAPSTAASDAPSPWADSAPTKTVPQPGTSTAGTETDVRATTNSSANAAVGADTDVRAAADSGADAVVRADTGVRATTDSGADADVGAHTGTAPGADVGASADVRAGADVRANTDSGADTCVCGRTDVGAAEGAGIGVAAGAGASVVPGHGAKPQISITIDFKDLAAATASATGAMIFGDNLSAATVRRLACDAEVLPIVLGSKSQPLDVGTSQRLVTRPMRRALNARDKGCVVCGAPPIACDAHHLISWIDGGITAVSNLVLLCKRHHQDLHSGHWQIRILDGVVHVTRPFWMNPTSTPPGTYAPPPPPPNPWDLRSRPTPTGTQPPADPWGEPGMPTDPPQSPAPAIVPDTGETHLPTTPGTEAAPHPRSHPTGAAQHHLTG